VSPGYHLRRPLHLGGGHTGPLDEGSDHGPGPPVPGAATPKKSLHASERDKPRVQQARADDHAGMQPLAVERSKVIDASGSNLAMTRLFGRAPRGERTVDTVPQHYGPHVTMIEALSR
jgi:hypothetical protein